MLTQSDVVCPLVQQLSLYRPQIFLPLLFHMNQRPLPAAEGKVLQAGEHQQLVVSIAHTNRKHSTPWGREASFTVMV